MWVDGKFGAFEKNKCIFSIASMGNLEKSRECFLTEKDSPDAECGGTGRWSQKSGVLDPARVEHRTLFESVRWCASDVKRFCKPLCALVR